MVLTTARVARRGAVAAADSAPADDAEAEAEADAGAAAPPPLALDTAASTMARAYADGVLAVGVPAPAPKAVGCNPAPQSQPYAAAQGPSIHTIITRLNLSAFIVSQPMKISNFVCRAKKKKKSTYS